MYLVKVEEHEYLRELVLSASDMAKTTKVYSKCNVDIADIVDNPWLKIPPLEDVVVKLFREIYHEERPIRHNYWINKYPKGAFQELHSHEARPGQRKDPLACWSYFTCVPPNSSNMVFPIEGGDDIVYTSEHEGYIAFFSGKMPHHVTHNESEYERVTVAGNIFLKG